MQTPAHFLGRQLLAVEVLQNEFVVGLGRSLDLRVVAEGVETETQARFLKALQCDEIQGYLVSKPLPPDAFQKFLTEYTGLAI